MPGSTVINDTSIPSPSAYSPLSLKGHSLLPGFLNINEGQWSNLAEVVRTNTQAQLIYNFQQLTRGIWSNPTGIGWQPQRANNFNGGAAFMDFGVFEDFEGNQTLLFQVGNTLYSYDLATSTETAYGGGLANLSTSLINLPTMRSFVDNTGTQPPITVYTNGAIQPQKILGPAGNQGTIAEYATPTASSEPTDICLGSDGNLYFCEYGGNKICQLVPSTQVMTEYTIPTSGAEPQGICSGPDGNIWFCEYGAAKIGSFIINAGPLQYTFIEHLTPSPSSQPWSICSGPDGNLWITEFGISKILRMTTAGVGTEYATTTGSAGPKGICVGPDENLWFCEYSVNKIGKIVPATGTVTEYTITTSSSEPTGICKGSDNRLYFTEYNTDKIGAITTTGTITEYTIPTTGSLPLGITDGPDSNIWFTESLGNKIGSMTTAGVFTEYVIPSSTSNPHGIVTGPNSQLWFTEYNTSKVGSVSFSNLPLQFTATIEEQAQPESVSIVSYALPTANSFPSGICLGPNANIWFAHNLSSGNPQVGQITSGGTITEYDSGGGTTNLVSICAGPDGNIWTVRDSSQISVYSTAGAGVAVLSAGSGTTVIGNAICAGPDGNIWFTSTSNNLITAVSTAFSVVYTYTVPTSSATPYGICSGPDGNLWFTEFSTNKIGKVVPSTGAFTEYTIPTASCRPVSICVGPDNNLYFTEYLGNKIGCITTAGNFQEFVVPTASCGPRGICAGPDGNIWFTEYLGNKIGMMTLAGVFTEYSLATPSTPFSTQPLLICSGGGESGTLWFTQYASNQIGKITINSTNTTPTFTTQTTSWPGIFYLNQKTYSKPKYSTYFNNRMAYFGFDPTTPAALDVLISNQGSAESFTTSTPIQATDAVAFTIPGLGLPTGCTAFRLANTNNQEVLILGFQRGIAVIAGNGTSSDATTYELTILTREYGLMSNRSFTQIQNDMYFFSTNGWRSFSNLSINANLLNASWTYQMQDVVQNITSIAIPSSNILYNSQSFAVSHPDTLEVQFWYPSATDGDDGVDFTNQHAIIMNYNTSLQPTPQQLAPVFSTKGGTSVSCGIEFQGTMYGGGYDGLLQTHYSGNTYNGAAIPGQLQFSLIAGTNIQQNISLRQGIVVTESENPQDFNVLVYFFTKQQDGTIIRTISTEGLQSIGVGEEGETILGSWELGISSFPDPYIKYVPFTATGEGPFIDIDISTNGVSQALDFALLAYVVTVGALLP